MDPACVLLIPDDRSRVNHMDWVRLEQETGHDAEVTTAAA
jgi:hypothetical protein